MGARVKAKSVLYLCPKCQSPELSESPGLKIVTCAACGWEGSQEDRFAFVSSDKVTTPDDWAADLATELVSQSFNPALAVFQKAGLLHNNPQTKYEHLLDHYLIWVRGALLLMAGVDAAADAASGKISEDQFKQMLQNLKDTPDVPPEEKPS